MEAAVSKAIDKIEAKVDRIDAKVDTLSASIAGLHTAIVGVTGADGLIGQVKCLSREQNNMKRNFWVLIASLAGSGVFTASIVTYLRW